MSKVGVKGTAEAAAPGCMACPWVTKVQGKLGFLIVIVAAAVLFAPALFLGQHAVAFHYERGSWTGLSGGSDPASCRSATRSYDASPLCIHYPNEALVAESLRHGELPAWNPYAGAGTAALGGGSVYPFSPFFWPFYLFPNPWVYTACLLLICLWGGAGVVLWLGRFGLPGWARGFGAAAWILGPWVAHFFTYSDVWAGAWFGWLLWAWDRFIHNERLWYLPAPLIAGMVYCGHPEVALVLAGASGAYALVSWMTLEGNGRVPLRGLAVGGMGAAALAVALTAVHWLPVALRATESLPYKFVSPQALLRSAGSIGDFFSPRSAVYIAPAAFGIALLGLAWMGRSRVVLLALLLPVVSLVGLLQPAVLGPVNHFLTLGGLVPGFYYRCLLWFGLVPFLAVGAVSLAIGARENKPWRLAMLLVPVFLYLTNFIVAVERPGWTWVVWQGATLAMLGAAAGLVSPSRKRWVAVVTLSLVCLDPFVLLSGCLSEKTPFVFKEARNACYSRFTSVDPSVQDPSSWGAAKDLLEKSHGRIWAGASGGASPEPYLAPNLATVWKVRDLRIQDVLLGRRLALLHQTVQGPGQHSYFSSLYFSDTSMQDLALLGVSHLGRPTEEGSGCFIWERVPDALPRAYLVHEVRAAVSEEVSVRLWREGLVDRAWFRGGAVVEGWTGSSIVGSRSNSDTVTWLEDGLARVRIKTATDTGGILILLDAVAEGWESRVDGRPVPLYPANLAFRAVAVPPGTHEVVFSYEAPGLARGLFLASMGWIAVIGMALSAWKRTCSDHRRASGGAV